MKNAYLIKMIRLIKIVYVPKLFSSITRDKGTLFLNILKTDKLNISLAPQKVSNMNLMSFKCFLGPYKSQGYIFSI